MSPEIGQTESRLFILKAGVTRGCMTVFTHHAQGAVFWNKESNCPVSFQERQPGLMKEIYEEIDFCQID